MQVSLSSDGCPAGDDVMSLTSLALPFPVDLADVWRGLVTGRLRITNSTVTAGRCFISLQPGRLRPVSYKFAEAMERVFAGEQPKVVAADLSLSLSTICHYNKRFLLMSSAHPNAAGVSAFLVAAACAARGAKMMPPISHGCDGEANLVLSVEMPLASLARASLSQAERDIASSIIEGRTRAEIGARRGTSLRTLANQINSIYRKFRVSGRRELIAVVLSGAHPPSFAAAS